MKYLEEPDFATLLSMTAIKPRIKRDVRFRKSVEGMDRQSWEDRELLAIKDRNENKGILIISVQERFFLLPYELKTGLASSKTGRAQPIICDFCRTWQTGSRAGSITFLGAKTSHDISFLCCADLKCSEHVRSRTEASKTSRAQLREDMTDEQRVDRLQQRLEKIITDIGAGPGIVY